MARWTVSRHSLLICFDLIHPVKEESRVSKEKSLAAGMRQSTFKDKRVAIANTITRIP